MWYFIESFLEICVNSVNLFTTVETGHYAVHTVFGQTFDGGPFPEHVAARLSNMFIECYVID